MSEIVKFKSEEFGELLVEVDEELEMDLQRVAAGEKISEKVKEAAKSFEDTIDPVLGYAQHVVEALKKVQPDGLEVEFGIKIAAEAGVLAKIGGEANFNVKVIWGK